MEKISSFLVNHTKLKEGIYISRIDGDIITYDLRAKKPNAGDYMSNIAMHSIEHLFATFIRNSSIGDKVIYFGPMGCQTGFYLLVRDLPSNAVVAKIKEILNQIIDYRGEVPGNSELECGNYRMLNLEAAQAECLAFYNNIVQLDDVLSYPV